VSSPSPRIVRRVFNLKQALSSTRVLFFSSALLLLTSCASTHLDSQWINPEFSGQKMTGKIMVVGITKDETLRRRYEDEIAAQLASRGVSTARSYDVIPGTLQVEAPESLIGVARMAQATALLSSVVIGREHMERVISEPLPLAGRGFDGWYRYYWPYAYVRTEVRSFERYTVSTSLTEVASGKIVWTARTQTDETDRIDLELKALGKIVIDALTKAGQV
jgi:hypothetical protein